MNSGAKQLASIALFAVVVACVPLVTTSGVVLNFVMMALYATLIAQAWNILGGFGGQFSFGHALFFGTGAYIQAIAQLQGGINAWIALPMAVAGAALVGLFVGALTFRYGLKGSYFALVTLAFAEVFRIVATSVPFTGGGVGLMVPLRRDPPWLMIDLFSAWNAPVLLVARTGLGTINHSLLSIEAMRARQIEIAGLLFVGDADRENESVIPALGGVRSFGRLPLLDPLDAQTLAEAMNDIDLAAIRTAIGLAA